MTDTVVVIPAYNEGERLGTTLEGLRGLPYDLVVVDDGSTDDTAARGAGVTVLRHHLNRGQGAALQTGTNWALQKKASFVVHFDADGQFEPSDIGRALDILRAGSADVVLGSRFLGQDNQLPFTKRYLIFPVARFINWAFSGMWLSDVHNGFRAMTAQAAAQLNITADRMAHNTHIVSQIRKQKLSYQEMPVSVYYHRYGQGVRGGIRILSDLLIGFFT